jgi:hypothetical protein
MRSALALILLDLIEEVYSGCRLAVSADWRPTAAWSFHQARTR